MEVIYLRKLNRSYMIIEGEEEFASYELAMLQNNQIAGILSFEMIVSDGKVQYWYDITGKRALDTIVEKGGVNGILLRKLLTQLEQIVQRCGRYLLSERNLCLGVNDIFIDHASQQVWICYYPMKENHTFQELMEYLIQKIDHSDQQAVMLGYEVYQKSVEDQFSLSGTLAAYLSETDGAEGRTERKLPQKEYVPTLDDQGENPEEQMQPFLGKPSWGQKYREKVMDHLPGISWKKKNHYVNCVQPFEDLEPENQENCTMYLGPEIQQEQGILHYEGKEERDNIHITKEIFTLGSREDEVDGYLKSDTVSRLHAQIHHQPDGYYLEDLNSMNGTTQNGKLLDYKQKVKLNKDDLICFASEPYRFL